MASRTASSLAALLAALLLLASPARALGAEPPAADRTLAQSLFDEGRRLMDGGRYDQACPRFADSQRLDPGGGTVLNLALCYEKLGALALAHSTYNEALSFAISERRREREDFARQRIASLGARLPRLVLRLDAAPAGLAVALDGAPVPPSAWGIATPLDPGRHTVSAEAPGFAPFQAILTFDEGQTRDLAVRLSPERPVEAPRPPSPWSTHVESRRSTAFWIMGGLGIAAAATSGVTGVLALTTHQSVQQECNTDRGYCSTPGGPGDASRARTLAWVSTLSLGGAIVAGVVAIALPISEHFSATASLGGLSVSGTY